MNEILTKLGVSTEIQALFNTGDDLRFNYGDRFEHFYSCGHLVPASENLWRGGNELAAQVIIALSVMELIAFMTINKRKFVNPENLFFIATGVNYTPAKINWIRCSLKKRKFTLIFGNELTGRLWDIKVATGLRAKPVILTWQEPFVCLNTAKREFELEGDAISLAAFERLAGIRTNIRTEKSFPYNSFLEQLKDHGK